MDGNNQFKNDPNKGTKFLRRLKYFPQMLSDWRYYVPLVNTTPSLKDLYLHITPQYAADWEVIGTLLGLPSGELKAIEAGWPTNVKWCCNQMLKKWLESDTTASWGKLFTVIESPAVSCSAPDKGD